MSAQKFLRFQCHEFDAHFHHVEYNLTPYYALTDVRKDHDYANEGKPVEYFTRDTGKKWAAVLDFDDQPILPWSDPSYKLQTAYLYRIYLVTLDETYDDERPDRSKRVRGGTITIRPRWPEMKKKDDETGEISAVKGYMDLGCPYLDVQVQASNVDFEEYPSLVGDAFAAFGIPRRYFLDPHPSSNISDAAVYARVRRSESGPIYAADGPIARMHSLLEADRAGYRKHVVDNRARPGDYVASVVDDNRARKVIRGHRIGKEVKHYYTNHADSFFKNEYGYHPKVEVGYQTSATDETVYWEYDEHYHEDGALDRHDLRRELEELLVNVLDWSGLDIKGGEQYFDDAYFKADDLERRSLRLVDCPLPEIESEQEAAVIRLWNDMNASDRDTVETLLSDGGELSPQDVADKTGYCYDTILRAVDRLEEFVEHTYGSLAIKSDFAAQQMLKRVHAAEEHFRRSIGAATMQIADDATDVETDALDRFARNYDVGIDRSRDDCRMLLKPRYVAADLADAKMLCREAQVAVAHRLGNDRGVHMVVELADGSRRHIRDLSQQGWAGADWDQDAWRAKRERELESQVEHDDRDLADPDEIDWDELWERFGFDVDEAIREPMIRGMIPSVAGDVGDLLAAALEAGRLEATGSCYRIADR